MKTIDGVACGSCSFKENCVGCLETEGHPFVGECVAAECYKAGGQELFIEFKAKIIGEFNALGISDMQ